MYSITLNNMFSVPFILLCLIAIVTIVLVQPSLVPRPFPYLNACASRLLKELQDHSDVNVCNYVHIQCNMHIVLCSFFLASLAERVEDANIPAGNTKECRILNGTAYKLTLFRSESTNAFQQQHNFSFLSPEPSSLLRVFENKGRAR